jgi:hypothetical protein
MQELAKKLAGNRATLNEYKATYEELKAPLEQERDALQQALLEEMRKASTLSTRYEDLTITRKKSKKAVVTNEQAAIASIRSAGWGHYLVEAIAPSALKEIEKGMLALDGVTVEEKEYISVSQKKPEEN